MTDMVNHPPHYTQAAITIEPIDVLFCAPFDLGNCLKYIIRAGHKGYWREDLDKADFYRAWAMNSVRLNPVPYQTYLGNFGHLLCRFDRLRDINPFSDVRDVIRSLGTTIREIRAELNDTKYVERDRPTAYEMALKEDRVEGLANPHMSSHGLKEKK